jgi:hypothetical protein
MQTLVIVWGKHDFFLNCGSLYLITQFEVTKPLNSCWPCESLSSLVSSDHEGVISGLENFKLLRSSFMSLVSAFSSDILFIYLLGYWGLNSGTSVCQPDALLHEPCLQPFLLSLFFQIGSHLFVQTDLE